MDLSTILSIIGIVLALLSFFISPGWASSFINKSILASRQKRIQTLIEDYRFLAYCEVNRQALTAALIAKVANGLYHLTLFVFWMGIYVIASVRQANWDIVSINSFITFYFLFGVTDRLNSIVSLHNDFVDIHKYKEKTIKTLVRLGGNPEELDRIDEGYKKPPSF